MKPGFAAIFLMCLVLISSSLFEVRMAGSGIIVLLHPCFVSNTYLVKLTVNLWCVVLQNRILWLKVQSEVFQSRK